MNYNYNFREKVRELYAHDTNMNGDLSGSILDLMNNSDKIKSIDIRLSEYSIEIVLWDNCNRADKTRVDLDVREILYNYAMDNINNINIDKNEIENFKSFINYTTICDSFITDKVIKFNL